MKIVDLDNDLLNKYPFELSGVKNKELELQEL